MEQLAAEKAAKEEKEKENGYRIYVDIRTGEILSSI